MYKMIFVVPTYKRKNPKILQLLDDFDNIVINLCVRKEEYDSGFYDHLKENPKLRFIQLTNCTNLGNTRTKIIKYCIENQYDYCFMADDSVQKIIQHYENTRDFTKIFNDLISEMTTDKYAKYIISNRLQLKRSRKQSYIASMSTCVVLDINKIKMANINYVDSDICGHEDFVFKYDCHEHGFMAIRSLKYHCKGRASKPTDVEIGGTHDTVDATKACDFINQKSLLSLQYLQSKYPECKAFIREMKTRNYVILLMQGLFLEKQLIENYKRNEKNYEQANRTNDSSNLC